MKEMPQNQKDRAGWYDRQAELPENPATKIKITPKATGQLANGYSDVATPKQPESAYHAQTKHERSRVGGEWPGPKGRVGKVLHGKSSPSSQESWVVVKKNHEASAK
jgi:hypothetical protein